MDDPQVLVAALSRDDAAVYRVTEDRALAATVDFFTPIVDDAYTFGAIAAANALSDLYAMGATPLFALNIVAWPRDPELLELLGTTVRGGVDKIREAGAFVLGGHSIEDREPKFGMVAIGEIHPDRLTTNAGARPGDRLVLTKPIGTGILSTGLKRELITEGEMAAAIRSMTTLNAGAMAANGRLGTAVHAATDITGFGLLGHLHTMLSASGVAARLYAPEVPVFERTAELIGQGAVPGGTTRNLDDASDYTDWQPSIDVSIRTTFCDAQTSGGLLVAVASESVDRLLAALREEGIPAAALVGDVVSGRAGTIEVVGARA